MKRRFFIIGDTEMGKNDVMDDFHDDDTLVSFMDHIGSCEDDEVTLVLNGDVFDFLKMDYKGEYPRYITEDISLWKMEKVIESHPKVFEAWKKFLEKPNARLVFVIGNHDPDVVWSRVQEKIRETLGNASQITFTHAFDEEHFHVQHGNLIDPFFGFDHEHPILEHKGKKILNLPVGSHIASQLLTPFKAKFGDVEVMYPQKEVFEKYPEYKKEINQMMRKHGFKVFVIDPILNWHDPMYRVSYGRILKHLLKHGFDGVHDDRFLDIEELDTAFGRKELYILSHAHVKKDVKHKDVRYIFVDCWRTEINISTPDMKQKPKTYVEIEVADDKLVGAELKEYRSVA